MKKPPTKVLLDIINADGFARVKNDNLIVTFPGECPSQLAADIEKNRAALTALLQLDFLVIPRKYGDRIVALYWTPHDYVKSSLIIAGAALSSIFTASELRDLEVATGERWPVKFMWYGWESAAFDDVDDY